MTGALDETKKKAYWWKYLLFFLGGFLFYPGLFVPLSYIFSPGFTEWWIVMYARYLEYIWGF
jgi:hypothetical protein